MEDQPAICKICGKPVKQTENNDSDKEIDSIKRRIENIYQEIHGIRLGINKANDGVEEINGKIKNVGALLETLEEWLNMI